MGIPFPLYVTFIFTSPPSCGKVSQNLSGSQSSFCFEQLIKAKPINTIKPMLLIDFILK